MAPTTGSDAMGEAGAGLGLSVVGGGAAATAAAAEHGIQSTPGFREGTTIVIPPKTAEQFVTNDKNQVLWFSGPPIDVVAPPKPHHSASYLAKKQKLDQQRDQEKDQNKSQSQSQNQNQSGDHDKQTVPSSAFTFSLEKGASSDTVDAGSVADKAAEASAEALLPVVLQGIQVLHNNLKRDVEGLIKSA
ncbi:hypothetical protein BGW42_001102 [Actinomortierella wolfii]|nr:hypothetical protein BGW42_001102 [Actinomortierella wolfii]